jgi:hypothetical protein
MALLISSGHWSSGRRFIMSGVRTAAFAVLLLGQMNLLAQTPVTKEYQIKAVFLYDFSQFVEWPTNAFPESQTPLVIGVLGDDPFGTYLDETVQGEKVNGHPLVVQRYRSVEDAKNCQILFVSQSESERLGAILAALKDKNILTVADIKDFNKNGGVIRFVTEQNKIHIRINLAAAKNASLIISSKLLRAAEIVAPGKD